MTRLPEPPRPRRKRRASGPLAGLRVSFLTGLIVIAPLAITIWLIWTLTGWVDGWVLPLVPPRWQLERYIGVNLRGVGVVIFLIFTLLIGALARVVAGRAIIGAGEAIVAHVPLIGAVYGGLKQIAETLFTPGDDKFDRACLIEYPRKGLWGLGFVAGGARGEVARLVSDGQPGRTVAVFVPTTPNPTSGFLLFVPESELRYLDMPVEDAAKLVISGGLVYPPEGMGGAIEPDAARGNMAPKSTESR